MAACRMPHEIGVPKHSIRMTPRDDTGCNVWVPDARCLGMWRCMRADVERRNFVNHV